MKIVRVHAFTQSLEDIRVEQELAVVDARHAVVVPDSLPGEPAAMPVAKPVSTRVIVHELLRVRRAGWLLVTAAGSAHGKRVLRTGRRDGFHAICVVRIGTSTAKLTRLGAGAVFEKNRQDLVAEVARLTAEQGVQYAFDCLGRELAGRAVPASDSAAVCWSTAHLSTRRSSCQRET